MPALSEATIRDFTAFIHPRDRWGFTDLLEVLPRRTAGAQEELEASMRQGGSIRALPAGTAKILAEQLQVAPGLEVVDHGPLVLRGQRFQVGKNLSCALKDSEINFLALRCLYLPKVGLSHLAGLKEGTVLLSKVAQKAVTEYRKRLELTQDRFAYLLSGIALPEAARAIFKQASLGLRTPPPKVLDALGQFRPGDDFEAYRLLFSVQPHELERVWEFVAFTRSEYCKALESWNPTELLFGSSADQLAQNVLSSDDQRSREEGEATRQSSTRKDPPREESKASSTPKRAGVQLVPRALATDSEHQVSVTLDAPTLKLLPPGPSNPFVESLYYLSAFRRDLRVLNQDGSGHSFDLSEHLRAPHRLTVSPQGTMWISDGESARLLKLDGRGNPILRLDGGPRKTGALACDLQDRVWVADRGTGRIRVLSPQGVELKELGGAFDGGLGSLDGMALDLEAGSLWATDARGRRLIHMDLEGCPQTEVHLGRVPGGVEVPGDIAADGSGGVWVVDEGGGRLLRYTVAGMSRETLVLGTGSLRGAKIKALDSKRVLILDMARSRILVVSAGRSPHQEIQGLVAPQDGMGYAADLEIGPPLQVSSVYQFPSQEELPCVQSI